MCSSDLYYVARFDCGIIVPPQGSERPLCSARWQEDTLEPAGLFYGTEQGALAPAKQIDAVPLRALPATNTESTVLVSMPQTMASP